MLIKRIIQLLFLSIGGMLGILFIPELLELMNMQDIPFINTPYTLAVIGAIIFFIATFWLVDYVVNWIKVLEEAVVRAPVTDVLLDRKSVV